MTAPNPEGDVVLREDSDGKLQIYSSRFNNILMTFSRSMPATQRREFFDRLNRPALAALQPSPDAPSGGPVAWRVAYLPHGDKMVWSLHPSDPWEWLDEDLRDLYEVQPLYARQQAAPGRERGE